MLKVDDPEKVKTENLPKYPHRDMGLQWKIDLDRMPLTVTESQREVFQVSALV